MSRTFFYTVVSIVALVLATLAIGVILGWVSW